MSKINLIPNIYSMLWWFLALRPGFEGQSLHKEKKISK